MAVGELVSVRFSHPTISSNHPLLCSNAGSSSSIGSQGLKVVRSATHFGYVRTHAVQGVCTITGGDDEDMRRMLFNPGAHEIPKVEVRNTRWGRSIDPQDCRVSRSVRNVVVLLQKTQPDLSLACIQPKVAINHLAIRVDHLHKRLSLVVVVHNDDTVIDVLVLNMNHILFHCYLVRNLIWCYNRPSVSEYL